MSEPAVRYNKREAAQLYERGVGAARGGQRRMAAVLLARAVQLDPRHEQAWLWLSGVLDEPSEIAFCLRSVLSINPNNDRARRGLEWLEQRSMVSAQPGAAPAAEPQREERAAEPLERSARQERHERRERESWWVGFRHNRREMSRARLLVWMVPILLLVLTIGLNMTLRDAISRTEAQVAAATSGAPLATSTAAPTVVPLLETSLGVANDARSLAYLSALETHRAELRVAANAYRETTSKFGNSSVLHATAARTYRQQVDAAHAAIAELSPPQALEQAHTDYLDGLAEERSAMDDMLEFYGSYSVELVTRAILRLQDAEQRLDTARAAFTQAKANANSELWAPQTIR